jgi:hypothetical protein
LGVLIFAACLPGERARPWPAQPDAAWPAGCLIEGAAAHPTEPWLALACTNAAASTGAVLVFDASRGLLRSVTSFDDYVGWDDPALVQWHPDGLRLVTNVGTNGLALLDRAVIVGQVYPDQTRDGGVSYVWVGERLFTDTGHLFAIEPGDWRFEFGPRAGPLMEGMVWNATIGAAIGRRGHGLVSYDPVAQAVRYEAPLDAYGATGAPTCAPSGRWCVRRQLVVHPAPDGLLFVDGDTGAVAGLRHATSPRVDDVVWSVGGALAVTSYEHVIGGDGRARWIEALRDGARAWARPLGDRRVTRSHEVADASGMAWSPSGDALAALLDGPEVWVFDGRSGETVTRFVAPAAPVPAGAPEWYRRGGPRDGAILWAGSEHIVRIAPHFVTAYTARGARVCGVVAP